MKLFLILTLLATNVYAVGRRVTFTSGSPGVTTYDTTGKSLIVSEVGDMRHWDLYNYTSYDLDCIFYNSSVNAPANGNGVGPGGGGSQTREIFLVASERLPLHDFLTNRGTSVYCRGDAAAPTSGELLINAW